MCIRDRYTYDSTGIDFTSYLVTGYNHFGDPSRKKMVNYLSMYFNRTENDWTGPETALVYDNPSSCLVRSRWDFSDSGVSGKWGSRFQAYRLLRPILAGNTGEAINYGYNTIVTKNKLRGSGKVLSLYVESEAGKDMHLLGWSMSSTISGNV